MDPLALASAIERHKRDPEFDKGILAFFGEFMDEIKAKSGQASNQLKRKVSTLVSALSPETLQQILKRTSPGAQRRQFMLNASHTLAADTVLDLAKAVASASKHTMSEALLLLLTKLAKHSEKGTAGRRDKADTALRANMRQLIDDWDGAAALPEESYWQTLEQLIAEPATDAPASSGQFDVNPEYIVQMSLEVELFSATAKHAVSEMVKQGRIAALLSMVDQTPDANTVVWTLRRHLDNTGTIRRLLRDRPIDFEAFRRRARCWMRSSSRTIARRGGVSSRCWRSWAPKWATRWWPGFRARRGTCSEISCCSWHGSRNGRRDSPRIPTRSIRIRACGARPTRCSFAIPPRAPRRSRSRWRTAMSASCAPR
jgi:hypothetical protein